MGTERTIVAQQPQHGQRAYGLVNIIKSVNPLDNRVAEMGDRSFRRQT